MLLYVILVNFDSGVENMSTAFAMPGRILLMIWIIVFSIKLFNLRTNESK
jgi:hypothetical protein